MTVPIGGFVESRESDVSTFSGSSGTLWLSLKSSANLVPDIVKSVEQPKHLPLKRRLKPGVFANGPQLARQLSMRMSHQFVAKAFD